MVLALQIEILSDYYSGYQLKSAFLLHFVGYPRALQGCYVALIKPVRNTEALTNRIEGMSQITNPRLQIKDRVGVQIRAFRNFTLQN